MPNMRVKTTSSEQVWRSSDGSRTIYKVVMDYNGSPVEAQTFSDAISRVGWEGEVQTYEKAGRNGSQTFVKQPPKEGGFTPQSGGSPKSFGGQSGSKLSSDNFTMYLSYVKDLAVALIASKAYTDTRLAKIIEDVATGGVALYEQRPDNNDKEVASEAKTIKEEVDSLFSGEDEAWNPGS